MKHDKDNNGAVRFPLDIFDKSRTASVVSSILIGALFILAYISVLTLWNVLSDLILKATSKGMTEAQYAAKLLALSSASGIVGNVIAVSSAFGFIRFTGRGVSRTVMIAPVKIYAVATCIILGVSFNFFADSAIALMPIPESVLDAHNEIYSFIGRGNKILEIISVVIVTPVAEELFFRGLAYRVMRRRLPVAAAVVISSILFGAAHGNLLSLFYTTALGALLALSYEFTRSLVAPVAAHAAFNAASYVLPYILKEPGESALAAFCAAGAFLAALSVAALAFYSKRNRKKLL